MSSQNIRFSALPGKSIDSVRTEYKFNCSTFLLKIKTSTGSLTKHFDLLFSYVTVILLHEEKQNPKDNQTNKQFLQRRGWKQEWLSLATFGG